MNATQLGSASTTTTTTATATPATTAKRTTHVIITNKLNYKNHKINISDDVAALYAPSAHALLRREAHADPLASA